VHRQRTLATSVTSIIATHDPVTPRGLA